MKRGYGVMSQRAVALYLQRAPRSQKAAAIMSNGCQTPGELLVLLRPRDVAQENPLQEHRENPVEKVTRTRE